MHGAGRDDSRGGALTREGQGGLLAGLVERDRSCVVNSLPPLPDDLIDAVSQLNSDEGSIQWAMGDLLAAAVDEMGPVYATHPGIGSHRRARTYILRKIGDLAGVDDSTLREIGRAHV